MQNRGLVLRERCLTDQRGAVVTITPQGRDLITSAAPQHVANVRDALIDHLTESETANPHYHRRQSPRTAGSPGTAFPNGMTSPGDRSVPRPIVAIVLVVPYEA